MHEPLKYLLLCKEIVLRGKNKNKICNKYVINDPKKKVCNQHYLQKCKIPYNPYIDNVSFVVFFKFVRNFW